MLARPNMKLRLILNPKAGGSTARRKLLEVQRALTDEGLDHDTQETRGPGDAARLVQQAREDGVTCIGVVGGDGTLNEVSQGYLDSAGNPLEGPDLALIPAGTGGDFRRTFGVADDARRVASQLRSSLPKPLDLGILELEADNGERITRAFINIASFGIGGLTDRIVNQSPKWMGGRAAFFLGTLRAMASYRNAPVRVSLDGKLHLEAPILNVAIANGRYFGGGMMIAPEAEPNDGLFDVVALSDLNRTRAVALAAHIYRGSHIGQPGISVARAQVVEAEPLRRSEPVLIDMDGETPGRLPLRARIAHGALRIRA
jgi:YegS/Rv2252/BmrU family lipid kinase